MSNDLVFLKYLNFDKNIQPFIEQKFELKTYYYLRVYKNVLIISIRL